MTSLQLAWLTGSAGAVLVFVLAFMLTFGFPVDPTRSGVSLFVAFVMILVLLIRVVLIGGVHG